MGTFRIVVLVWLWACGHVAPVCGVKKKGKYEDTFASQPEHMWFDPGQHTESINSFISTWGGQHFLPKMSKVCFLFCMEYVEHCTLRMAMLCCQQLSTQVDADVPFLRLHFSPNVSLIWDRTLELPNCHDISGMMCVTDRHADAAAGSQTLFALDMFGASKRVAQSFASHGFKAAALDILIGREDMDVLTQRGWFNYLDHLMQLNLGCSCNFG